jgi:hypothetical protein
MRSVARTVKEEKRKFLTISFWLSLFTWRVLLTISFSSAHYIFLEITFHPIPSYTGSSEKKGTALPGSNQDANQEVTAGFFKEATRRALCRRKEKKMNSKQDSEVLRQVGFTEEEIERLNHLRKDYSELELQPSSVEYRRLAFIRWLVTSGKLSEQLA